MQTRPNSPETLPTILDGACAHPSPQLLTGHTLAPRADAFNDALPPPLPQMRDGGAPAFLRRHIQLASASLPSLTSAPHHLCRIPHPALCLSPCVCAPSLCPCLYVNSHAPCALGQFPSLFSATTPPHHVPASVSLHRSPQTRAEGSFL